MMSDDMTLVREFAATQTEPAFAALVERHLGLVHSAALREVGDPHLAEEISQAVFIILARKAAALGPNTVLSAWLYRTTRYAAADALKARRRRQAREQEAHMQSTLNDPDAESMSRSTSTGADWAQLAPLLDDALNELGETDRAALVLRFFENKTAREIATALRMEEEAAQKRVARALEKLRARFVKRGVALTATVIAGAVAANSVQAAPVGLAVTVTAAATKGATMTASIAAVVKGTMEMMTWLKLKFATYIVAAVVIAGSAVELALPEQVTVESSAYSSPHFAVEGRFVCSTFAGERLFKKSERLFSVAVDGDKWVIRTMFAAQTNQVNRPKFFESYFDGDAIYSLTAFSNYEVAETGSGTLNDSMGTVIKGDVPEFDASFIQIIWMAYCSGRYFASISSGQPISSLFGIEPLEEMSEPFLSAFTDQSNDTFGLPKTLVLWNKGKMLSFRRVGDNKDGLSVKQAVKDAPYPFNSGYTNCILEATKHQIVSSYSVPERFSVRFFNLQPDSSNSLSLKLSMQFEGDALLIKTKAAGTLKPTQPGTKTLVLDKRILTEQGGVQSYWALDRKWLPQHNVESLKTRTGRVEQPIKHGFSKRMVIWLLLVLGVVFVVVTLLLFKSPLPFGKVQGWRNP